MSQALAAGCARLLHAAAATSGATGLVCAALAAAVLALPAPPSSPASGLLLAVLALLPIERVLAFRLRFDAGLFADLAADPGPPAAALERLDQLLQTLRLRRASATPRPLAERVHAAQRLAAWHAACATLQFGALLAALAARGWS